MSSSQEPDTDDNTDDNTDQYDTLLRAAEEGLRLTVNESTPTERGTAEMRVLSSSDDETDVHVQETASGDQYRLHRDHRGELALSCIEGAGQSHEADVVTIEIHGC
jgi:hypothetical protein